MPMTLKRSCKLSFIFRVTTLAHSAASMPRTKQTAKKTTSLPGEHVEINGIAPPAPKPKPYTRSSRNNGSQVSSSGQRHNEAGEETSPVPENRPYTRSRKNNGSTAPRTAQLVAEEEIPSATLAVNAGEAGQKENNVSQRRPANQFDG